MTSRPHKKSRSRILWRQYKSLNAEKRDDAKGGVQICVTLFMDDPWWKKLSSEPPQAIKSTFFIYKFLFCISPSFNTFLYLNVSKQLSIIVLYAHK